MKVTIKSIIWLDEDGLEAEVLFETNGTEFWAFSHPCEFLTGETVEVDFDFIEEDIVQTTFWTVNSEQLKVITASKFIKWRYYCYGRLINTSPVEIDCGSIIFQYGGSINDKSVVGNYVYFVIARLDMIKSKSR